MATEYRLSYTASEINEKLGTVDETKAALENNYYTKDVIESTFREFDVFVNEVSETLTKKADLVDGKVPLEQLPDGIGSNGGSGGGGLTEIAWEDIKNKPFGEEGFTITWNGNTTGKITVCPVDGVVFARVSDIPLPDINALVGSRLVLTNDGVPMSITIESEYIEALSDNISFVSFEGEMAVLNVLATDTLVDVFDEPVTFETGIYFLGMFADSADTQAMVYVSSCGNQTLKQIDSKFIPNVFVKSTSVGKPNGVASLDGAGKIPVEQLPASIGSGDGNAVFWDNILDKPFEEISRGEKITWNGNTDGLTTVSLEMPDMGATFVCCKLSDMILTKEQAMDKNFEAYGEGNTISLSVDIVGGATPNGSFYMTNSDFGMPVIWMCSQADDTVVYEGDVNFSLTFPETGLWFFAMMMEGSVCSRAVSFTIPDVIKTLDIKYLPENMALGYETKAFEDIIWDGNTDGLPMVSVNADVDGAPTTLTVYKVSDCVLPITSMVDAEVEIVSQGEEDSSTMYEDRLYPCHSNGSYLDGEVVSFFCITENNTTVDMSEMAPDLMVEFPEAGIWFLVMETGGMEMQRTTALRAPRIVTKIDVKYLPTDEPYGVVTLDYAGMIAENRIRKSGTVSQWDNNPITSSAVFNALGGREQLSIDNSVSSSSDSPVSSKAVYKALGGRSKLIISEAVSAYSDNPVSSKAVYEALQNIDLSSKQDKVSVTTSDNGKFMRVVNGAWAAVAVPNAEDGEF